MSSKTNNIISGLICLVIISLLYLINEGLNQRSPYEPGDSDKTKVAVKNIQMLARKVCKYANTIGALPDNLKALVPNQLSEIPKDPYGRDFKLINNGSERAFVYYYGKNGRTKGLTPSDVDWAVRIEKVNNKFQIVHD